MVVKFLLDNQQKEGDAILKRIDEITKKDAYPDKSTAHLGTFLSACFDVEFQKRLSKLKRKEDAEAFLRKKKINLIRRRDEQRKIRELEAMAPSAPILPRQVAGAMPALPTLNLNNGPLVKKEYAIKIYDYPVGVLVDKDKMGRFVYKAFEPVVDRNILLHIEEKFGEKIGSNLGYLDDDVFIQLVSIKAEKKLKKKVSKDDYPKVKYFLKRDALGAGAIDILLYDPNVNSITIAGPQNISVGFGNYGKLMTNLKFNDDIMLNNLIYRIAQATGGVVNEQNPNLQVQFSGFNINATLGVGGKPSRVDMTKM